jgi:hypothetical protein
MKLFVVCVLALVAVACRNNPDEPVFVQQGVASPARWSNLSKSCDENSPTYSLPVELGGSLNIFPGFGLGRDAYIARTNPGGWGGRAFLDSGQYYMYFVDTTRTQELFATLRQRGILVPDGLELRKGRWDFAQLYEWSNYLGTSTQRSMLGFADVDVPFNRVDVVATTEAGRVKLDSIFSALDIPCFLAAIAVEPEGPPRGL